MKFQEDKLAKMAEWLESREPEKAYYFRGENAEEFKEYAKYLRQSPCFMDVEVIGDYEGIIKRKYHNL